MERHVNRDDGNVWECHIEVVPGHPTVIRESVCIVAVTNQPLTGPSGIALGLSLQFGNDISDIRNSAHRRAREVGPSGSAHRHRKMAVAINKTWR